MRVLVQASICAVLPPVPSRLDCSGVLAPVLHMWCMAVLVRLSAFPPHLRVEGPCEDGERQDGVVLSPPQSDALQNYQDFGDENANLPRQARDGFCPQTYSSGEQILHLPS